MNPIPLSWTIGGAAILLAALGASGYLLYDSIEDKGRLAATIEAKDKALARLADDIKRQETEAAIRSETYEAGTGLSSSTPPGSTASRPGRR